MSTEVFDPTVSAQEAGIDYAPRPTNLDGLRVALVENTKFNSKTLLVKIAERLKERHHMEVVGINTKQSPSHGVDGTAIREFKTKADFVIAGVGD